MNKSFIGVRRLVEFLRTAFVRVNPRPIIVLGNQKSGTSAIAHLLADFGGLSKTIDIPPLWPPTLNRVISGQVRFESVVRRNRQYFSAELIKEPNLTFFVDQVIARFPEARYVFVIRDPRDNIRSLLNSRGIPGNLEKLGEEYLPGSENHEVVADSRLWGAREGNYIDTLAERWNLVVDAYLRFEDRMNRVRFEDFMEGKYRCIAELAARVGVTERRDIRGRLHVQFQPRGDRDISWQEFFGSRNLDRIEHRCGPGMDRFGYTPR